MVLHHIGSPGLAFLRAIDVAEANTLRVGVVQDFDGVAVEDGHNRARKVGNGSGGPEQEQ